MKISKLFKHQIYLWLSAWCGFIDGIIGIISLGFYRPYLDFKFLAFYTKKELKEEVERRNTTLK